MKTQIETITKLFFVANLRHFARAEDGRGERPDASGYADEDGQRRSRNGAGVAGREFCNGLNQFQKGFTVLEISIATAVLILLGTLSLVSFVNSRRARDLIFAGQDTLSILQTARTNAAAGRDASQWGVRLEQEQTTLFRGSAYAGATAMTSYPLPSTVEIADIALAGGGSDVIFKRISGATDHAGTFIVRARGSATQTFPITVDPAGTAYRTGAAPALSNARLLDTRHRAFTLGWSIQNAQTLTVNFNDGELIRSAATAPYFDADKSVFDWSETIAVGGQNQILRIHASSLTPSATVLHIDRDCRRNTKKFNVSIDGKDITTYEANCTAVTVGAFGGAMSEP